MFNIFYTSIPKDFLPDLVVLKIWLIDYSLSDLVNALVSSGLTTLLNTTQS